ncbi:SDR family NAD(P)-dependent oxidoreductase [Ligilactobacillus salivarius]|uniref:SDR family NAD(P)-dependent oxidoreductase n=1 Tax=Ligilactobacillus salivarius TaxID=1624 RepID=UPI00136812FE|nr:SDR family oxidoreductase [Ligilactobacillus salivarius]MYY55653.1 SDR family oxidoreductase [Ligilactobacillus salivarius]
MKNYKSLKDLTNKVVLITGASGGLGEQIAYQVAKKGAIVVACARRKEKLDVVVENCQNLSKRLAYAYQLDISKPEEVEKVVNEVEEEVGPVSVLINNAGFGLMEDFLDFDMDRAEAMFRVNILGLMYATKYVATKMAERQVGAIINIASMAGKIATPKSTVYSATKFAVLGFSNALRLELKPLGISVMTVNPGPIRTEFFDKADKTHNYLNSLGNIVLDPEEVAYKIVSKIGTSRREVNLPYYMEVAQHLYEVFPHMADYLTGGIFNKK